MKSILTLFTALTLSSIPAQPAEQPRKSSSGTTAAQVEVARKADQKLEAGSDKYFTGKVEIAGQFQREDPARVTGALVTFQPRARTAWHSHPAGQTLIVTKGVGLVQQWGGQRQEIHEGDVVWIPPGVKHWHGASAQSAMSHIAIQEKLDGTNVSWLEHVTDEQYSGAP